MPLSFLTFMTLTVLLPRSKNHWANRIVGRLKYRNWKWGVSSSCVVILFDGWIDWKGFFAPFFPFVGHQKSFFFSSHRFTRTDFFGPGPRIVERKPDQKSLLLRRTVPTDRQNPTNIFEKKKIARNGRKCLPNQRAPFLDFQNLHFSVFRLSRPEKLEKATDKMWAG